MKNAIILCSGGLDSVVTGHYARKKLKYEKITILFFNYGQKSLAEERKSSKKCARDIRAKFVEINLNSLFSFFNRKISIRKIKRKELKDSSKESEKLYVPCRNAIFLTCSLALAESLYKDKKEIYDLFVGFKNEGKESYPDTTSEFVKQMNSLSKKSCYKAFKIKAPLIKKDKEDIVKLGINLGVNLHSTFSCYNSLNGKHCGYCLACRLRQEGFYWANIKDKTIYKEKMKDFRTGKN